MFSVNILHFVIIVRPVILCSCPCSFPPLVHLRPEHNALGGRSLESHHWKTSTKDFSFIKRDQLPTISIIILGKTSLRESKNWELKMTKRKTRAVQIRSAPRRLARAVARKDACRITCCLGWNSMFGYSFNLWANLRVINRNANLRWRLGVAHAVGSRRANANTRAWKRRREYIVIKIHQTFMIAFVR